MDHAGVAHAARVLVGVLAIIVAAVAALAEEPNRTPTPAPTPAIEIHGFADVYSAYNSNHPSDHESFLPGTGSTAKRANEFGLNLAALTISHSADPVGFTLVVNAGTGTDVIHSGEPANGREIYRAVYQASVAYQPAGPKGLQIEAGIYPSHIGFEGFFSKDNWNYTRGWLAEFSPYYETGVKVSLPLGESIRAQVHVLNGWQNIHDNNGAKSVGAQLQWSSTRFSAAVNGIYGAELPSDDSSKRAFGDVWVSYRAIGCLTVAGVVDAGWQEFPGAPASVWHGFGAYARYAFSDAAALAVRIERFDDPDGAITGSAQRLRSATLTLEGRPRPNLILKLEARYDRASDLVFRSEDGAKDRQRLLILGAVASF